MSLTIRSHSFHSQLSLSFRTPKYRPFSSLSPNPIFHKKAIFPALTMSVSGKDNTLVKSSLIEPDGGRLVDLVVPEGEREGKRREAEGLEKVRLTRVDVEWVHVLSEGWASPLRGFMREREYLQSLHFNSLRLESGGGVVVNMSLPIVLAIDDEAKERVGSEKDVGLVGPGGELVAILRRCVHDQ